MELRSGLLTLCLLSIIPASNAEPNVLVTVPSLLKSGEAEKACLTANQHTAPMDVQVTLEVNMKNYTVIDEQVPPGDIFKAYDFQVPEVTESTPAFLLVNAICGSYNYTARRAVAIATTGNVAFVQTDKYLYKGGQEVRIYVMSVDNNLRPVEETFSRVYVKDPSGNLIHQWLDQSTNGDFLLLRFTMLEDPIIGTYQIVAERKSGSSVSKEIRAEQYALPKFSIMMKRPNTVTILDKNISVEISGRYTYNQGVPGIVSGRLCRPPAYYYAGNSCNRDPDGICVLFTGKTDLEGKFKGSIDLSSFQLDRSGLQMSFILKATLTEQGTNVQMTDTGYISITSQLGRAYFDKDMPQYFRKGIPFPVRIGVEDAMGEPQSDQVVELQVNGKLVGNLTSDKYGKAEFEIDTSTFDNPTVNLQLIYKTQQPCYDSNWIVPSYSNDYRTINRFYTRTGSVMQLQGPREELKCGKSYNFKVQYIFGKEALPAGQTTVKIGYIAMSRSKIVASGEHSVDLSASLKGEFNLTYETSPDHVPILHYMVQCLLKDELVGDIITLNLENCFKNQVSANFSSEIGTPGSNVSLDVTSTSESTCLVRVSDSSLQLLDQGQTFSAAMVYNSLLYNRLYGYYAAGLNVAPTPPDCIDVNKQMLFNGIYWQPVNSPQDLDLGKLFSDIGMHVITAIPFQQPQLCSQPYEQPIISFGRPAPVFMTNLASDTFARTEESTSAASAGPATITSVRSKFPEMWFSDIISIGASGSTLLPLEVPDTITKWNGNVVCLSNQTGFGMTKYPANFTSFQKLFVDVSLSESIIRGEIMYVVGSVANYLDKCAKVRVSLTPSGDYQVTPDDVDPVKCVCSQERVSYSWKINATLIGESNVTVTAETMNIGETCDGPADPNEPNRKDTIVRTFFVAPEGIKYEVTKTDFVCVKGANSAVQVSINPTGRIVPGSMKAKVQVIGDMLGRALTNPEALIVEPTGCGEQNLATLMPIVSAMKFLNITGHLTDEIKHRAIQYLSIGYVKQMRYRHSDGSFSAFGPGRSSPSAWLTLLSLQALWEASEYIFIDPNVFKQGTIYMEKLQELPSGRFRAVGTMFNNGLKGDADDNVAFTCAVVTFLAQTSYAATLSLLRPALSYLDEASRNNQTVYNYAMLFYAFRVAGNEERANAMYEKLKSLAIDDGGSLHWERPVRPPQQTPYLFTPRGMSADIQMTAIVLKALAYGENSSTVSTEKLNEMAKISNYLAQQQNIHGSYRTTSDTVEVIKALCLYGGIVYQNDATNTVQLKLGDKVFREFNVDQSNRIFLQSEALPRAPADYSMVVSGNGCMLLQTGVQFSVPFSQENPAFSLSVTTFREDCKNGVAYTVNIQVNSSYHGIQNKSNMAVIEMPMLSGYTMDYDSLLKLQSRFPKAEVKNGILIVYFDDMTSEGVSFNVTQSMGPRVLNFQQRTISAYDYYEKDENGFAALFHPCTLSG